MIYKRVAFLPVTNPIVKVIYTNRSMFYVLDTQAPSKNQQIGCCRIQQCVLLTNFFCRYVVDTDRINLTHWHMLIHFAAVWLYTSDLVGL